MPSVLGLRRATATPTRASAPPTYAIAGGASSIRKEWEWRKLRGEPTKNLEAFRGWLEAGELPGEQDGAESE